MKKLQSIRFGYYTATVFRANGTTRTYHLTNASRKRLYRWPAIDNRDGSLSIRREVAQ